MRTHIASKQRTRTGVLWIHSAPVALQPHLTWAIARLTLADGTKPGRAIWRTRPQVSAQGSQSSSTLLCAELEWTAENRDIETLVDDLSRWPHITFEIAVDAPETGEGGTGMRYLHTPELGTFAAMTDDAGNILVNEERLRTIMARSLGQANNSGRIGNSGSNGEGSADSVLADALDSALGGPWDRAIEPLRPGTAGFDDDFSFVTEPTNATDDYASNNVVMLHPRRSAM